MPRKPKPTIKRRTQEEGWRIYYLLHGELPFDLGESFEAFLFIGNGEEQREVWDTVKEGLLQEWIHRRPCTRPWAWYEFDAPRQDDPYVGWFIHGTLPEERWKVAGEAAKTSLAYRPRYRFGVFQYWDFDEDPPLFESEAVYLRRLSLLTKPEERHLAKHPELLNPVSYDEIFDEK